MAKHKIDENMHEDGNSTVSGKKKGGIIAFIICVLIALAIWTYAKNVEFKNENAFDGDSHVTDAYTEKVGE